MSLHPCVSPWPSHFGKGMLHLGTLHICYILQVVAEQSRVCCNKVSNVYPQNVLRTEYDNMSILLSIETGLDFSNYSLNLVNTTKFPKADTFNGCRYALLFTILLPGFLLLVSRWARSLRALLSALAWQNPKNDLPCLC